MTDHEVASTGVIYIAFGDYYIAEAVHSAQSVRQHCPDLNIVLFTDKHVDHPVFTEQRIVPISHIRAKVDLLAETPFERTLYLDSDTRVVRDIRDMFALLARVDVALTHDFARDRAHLAALIPEYAAIPPGFPEMNGGLLLYRRCPAVDGFLRLWRETFYRYRDKTNGWDQASLRVALWQSDVRMHTLPVEYNVRSAANRQRAEKARRRGLAPGLMEPRILHWHGLHDEKWWHRFSPKYRGYSF